MDFKRKLMAIILAAAMMVCYMPALAFAEGDAGSGSGLSVVVSKTKASTCDPVEFTAKCQDATKMEFYLDQGEGSEEWKQERDANDSYEVTDAVSCGTEGTYDLVVIAYDEKGEELGREETPIEFTAENGDLSLDMPELPSYLVAGKDSLDFTVSKPKGAESVRARVEFELEDYEGDNTLFEEETDGNSLAVKVGADKLKEGMTVRVNVEAWGRGYNSTWEEKRIPVIGTASQDVKMTASKTAALVNEDIKFTVDAGDKNIEQVSFFNGWDFEGEEGPDGDDDTRYTRWHSLDEAGTFGIFAKVQLEGSKDCVTTNVVEVKATSNGKVGKFSVEKINDKANTGSFSVKQGEMAKFTYSKATNADHYWIDVLEWDEGRDDWSYYGSYGHTDQLTANLGTGEFATGNYLVSVKANAVGYESYETEKIKMEVTKSDTDEGRISIATSKTEALTCEPVDFTAYCPNADYIGYYLDLGDGDSWEEYSGGNGCTDTVDCGREGTYKLVVVAYDEEDNEITRATKAITFNAPNGDLELTKPELPSKLIAGKDSLGFTVSKPKGADTVKARVQFELEGYEGEDLLFEEETNGDSLKVSVGADKLQEDMLLYVTLEAWGRGYNSVWEETRIPVVGEASQDVKMTASKTDALVNEDVKFTVDAGNRKIEKVRFFNGWELEGESDPDENDDTKYTRMHSLDETGTFGIYAKVKLAGSEEWVTTNAVDINVTSKGQVGEFTVKTINGKANTGSFSVKQGKFADFTYSESKNAEEYWIDVFGWDEQGQDWDHYGSYGHTSELTASLGTGEFEPGTYQVTVKATAVGYESYETQPVEMEVTDSGIDDNKLSLEVSRTEALTCEPVEFTAYCPSAKRLEYFIDTGDDDDYIDYYNGNSITDSIFFDVKGDWDLVVVAYDTEDEGGKKIDEARKTITYKAPYGPLKMDMPELPATVSGGEDFTFTVNMPANGISILAMVWDKSDGKEYVTEDNVIAVDRTGDKTLTIKVPANKLKGVSKLGVRIIGYGVGYEYADKKYEIAVTDKEEVSDRIYGKTRYETAIKVADKYKGTGKLKNVVVAYGKNFPDALAGGYLAKVKDAPILLVEPKEENSIVNYIDSNIEAGGTVYLLGGTGVVSSSFESKLTAKGINTKRLGGKDRYETNLAILKEAGVTNQDILVCTGTGYADSLSASAAGLPILLVSNNLSGAQKTYLKTLGTGKFYLIGGTGAVKPAIDSDLRGLGYNSIERLAGSTRYETSTAVAGKFFPNTKTVLLAYAQNFPDGLSGGPLAMQKNAPIVLTDSNKTTAAKTYVNKSGAKTSITLGGPTLISEAAVKAIMGK